MSTSPPLEHTRDDLLYAVRAAVHLRFDESIPLEEDIDVEREAVRRALRTQPDRVRLDVDRLLQHVRATRHGWPPSLAPNSEPGSPNR
ncbi:hypothetical protein [Nonomuraea sp. NPDC049784]|uniref:hypothetical protein n=1 Tax=Nonomuraea sp. NPDC049784 TaxID=3154361 RepID=UPI0033C1549F